jgi:simple sugar transport system permease protein
MNLRNPRLLLAPFAAILGALSIAAVTMVLLSDSPGDTVFYLLAGPFLSRLAAGDLLESSARLVIAGLAASLAFRSGSFNLGGEGQALAGGLSAAAVAVVLPDLPGFAALPLALLAGMLTGALMGSISGVLRALWGVDELISSFLLSAAAIPAGQVLLGGVLKDPQSYLIAAPPLPRAYRLGSWWPPSRLGPVIIWAAVLTVLLILFLGFTRRGYEWKLKGANEQFARYGGIRTGLISIGALSLSGAFYAAAGTAALLDSPQAVQGFTAGLGWDGLAVALIAGSRPSLVPLAALAYTWIIHGSRAAMMHTGFPYALSGLVQAAVFLLVTASALSRPRRKR